MASPGTVGGAVYMNAGAYGGEMKDVLEAVSYLTADGRWVDSEASELDFSYRHSAFEENDACILGAVFHLEKGDPDAIKARMNELMQKRIDKQPLDKPSAGSTFKRPAGAFAAALIDQCGLRGLPPWRCRRKRQALRFCGEPGRCHLCRCAGTV